jgi:hypothetical protein
LDIRGTASTAYNSAYSGSTASSGGSTGSLAGPGAGASSLGPAAGAGIQSGSVGAGNLGFNPASRANAAAHGNTNSNSANTVANTVTNSDGVNYSQQPNGQIGATGSTGRNRPRIGHHQRRPSAHVGGTQYGSVNFKIGRKAILNQNRIQ